jgi:DNA mismatch repair enzyme (predicted ATPase)
MAYDGILHGHQHAAYLLFMEVDPENIDVNVHPTKHEIRFLNQREVHEFVRHFAKSTLAQFQTATAELSSAMKLDGQAHRKYYSAAASSGTIFITSISASCRARLKFCQSRDRRRTY